MLTLTRTLSRLVGLNPLCLFSTYSFSSLLTKHKELVNNLQKIAEKDRKFVSFESEIWDTQVCISDLEEMYECCSGDDESQKLTETEMEKSFKLTQEMKRSMCLLNASVGSFTTAIIDFHSGTGGEDANDWTRMLFDMYRKFCVEMKWKCDILSCQNETEGIRNGTLRVEGDEISSFLALENGIHRLVRVSPFDSNKRRHTSFSSVCITPIIHQHNSSTLIRQQDIQVERFKSSGPGGQHVNKTESAIRLTHIPTGIVAECQAERNQHQNMEMAMELLKAKIDRRDNDLENKCKQMIYDEKDENSWGNQESVLIRSYVMHPYTMVKDHIYGVSTSNVDQILDGKMVDFMMEIMERKLYSDYKITDIN